MIQTSRPVNVSTKYEQIVRITYLITYTCGLQTILNILYDDTKYIVSISNFIFIGLIMPSYAFRAAKIEQDKKLSLFGIYSSSIFITSIIWIVWIYYQNYDLNKFEMTDVGFTLLNGLFHLYLTKLIYQERKKFAEIYVQDVPPIPTTYEIINAHQGREVEPIDQGREVEPIEIDEVMVDIQEVIVER